MEIIKNPHRKNVLNADVSNKDIHEVRYFHSSLPNYSPTPLIELRRFKNSDSIGNIYIKDEGKRFGLKAFKALGASYAIYQLLKEKSGGKLKPIDFLTEAGLKLASNITFTTATDGNHGRAVAWVAKLLKRPSVIYMPKNSVKSRIEAIESEGAEVIIVDGSYDDAVRTAADHAGKFSRTVISDTGYEGYMEIPVYIQRGYLTMFSEIDEQISAIKLPVPDLVFIQGGVGAFAAAAANFFSSKYKDAVLVAVEPTSADCLLQSAKSLDGSPQNLSYEGDTVMAGLNCGTPSLTAWEVIKKRFDYFISIEDHWAEEAMRIYAEEGVISGESGAAGLGALLALIKEEKGELQKVKIKESFDILLINTEADTDPENYFNITGMRGYNNT